MKVRWRWDGDDRDFVTYQNPATGAISVLNPVAAQIFAASDGKRTVNELVEQIAEEFETPDIERVRADTVEFLGFMEQIGAIMLLKS